VSGTVPSRVSAALGRARRVAPGLVYPLLLGLATAVLAAQPAGRQEPWRQWASTSVDNLQRNPLGSLVVSAFVAEGDLLAWMLLGVVGLCGLAWVAGPTRTVALCVAGHLVGTVVSEGIVAARVLHGDLPDAARRVVDVGPSYVVVTALVACVLYGRLLAVRLAGAVGFALLAPSLFDGLSSLEVSAVGHVTAIAVAAVLGWWLVRPARPGARAIAGSR
jgi:hypothetical protein